MPLDIDELLAQYVEVLGGLVRPAKLPWYRRLMFWKKRPITGPFAFQLSGFALNHLILEREKARKLPLS